MASKNKAKQEPKTALPAKLERHPLSEKYGPKMSAEELEGLAADIKAHGLHEPIITFEGKVLAGWNRYEACLLAKYTPKFREKDAEADATAVAFGTNFMRRRLSSVQKAFYGAQFCVDRGLKQTDVAKQMACNLNRLNRCCQLLKLETPEARKVIDDLRDNPDIGSATFDEMMLELGIAHEPKPRAAPARASGGSGIDSLDDDDPLGGGDDLSDLDDVTGGAIDMLLDNDDDAGDDDLPTPATRKKKGGDEIGDDTPLPAVGGKRTKQTNPHETPVSRISSAFKRLSPAEQRQFVKFTWGKLKAALDEAFSHGDVEYTMPPIKVDPSVIARGKPANGKLDDGAAAPKGKASKKAAPAKPTPSKSSKAPAKAPAKKAAPAKAPAKKSAKPKAPPPAKGNGRSKHHDADI